MQYRSPNRPPRVALKEDEPVQDPRLDHLGVEAGSTKTVTAAADRPRQEGSHMARFEEKSTSCRYALQGKVWVHRPGKEPWGPTASRPTPPRWVGATSLRIRLLR
ncbi:glyoxalase [Streptomyces chrestomyceticus JCM 4735]|uniref:Glyoxalase n=1 Tax=Streptomyces chrestomyceticus JCM 4735 TaxID=1306181 RepID=A0A7U9L3F4_9ACTN|nr:glyoxalase [Streptomyces chrestomyceticus JCM 4735]